MAWADDAVNALHDGLNDAVPWLWTPLQMPLREARLGAPEHALFAVHAAIGLVAIRATLPRALRRPATGLGVTAAAATWTVFTGAWDRRADGDQEATSR